MTKILRAINGTISASTTAEIKVDNSMKFTRIRIFSDNEVTVSMPTKLMLLSTNNVSNLTVSSNFTVNGCISLVFPEQNNDVFTISITNSNSTSVKVCIILDFGTE